MRIELVQNGRVVRTADSRAEGGHFEAVLAFDLDVKEPCWLALRTPPPPVADDPELQAPVPKNELGGDLFAHTSAVYVTLAGREHFDAAEARGLLSEMRGNRHFVEEHAVFADAAEREEVLAVYDEGIARLSQRLAADPD